VNAGRNLLGIAAVLLAGLGGCSSDTPTTQHVQLAALGFDVPAGWQRTDTQRPGLVTSEWRPEANGGKESLLVIRTETASIPRGGGAAAVEKAAIEIQKGFNKAHVGRSTHLKTRSGLEGVSIDVDFEPAGAKGRYHRVHVVLVDESSSALIHVLYTARTPDPERIGLQMVLDSIRHEEA
jgi:hypothetical protein